MAVHSGPNSYQYGPNFYQYGPNSYQDGPNSYQYGSNSYQDGPNSYRDGSNSYQDGPNSYRDGSNSYGMAQITEMAHDRRTGSFVGMTVKRGKTCTCTSVVAISDPHNHEHLRRIGSTFSFSELHAVSHYALQILFVRFADSLSHASGIQPPPPRPPPPARNTYMFPPSPAQPPEPHTAQRHASTKPNRAD